MRAALIQALVLVATACSDARLVESVVERRDPLIWSGEQKLAAGDAAEFDQLGNSVSLDGESALLGAYGESAYRGAAYFFVRSGSAWTEQQKLVASDGAEGDSFGYSVSLAGDRALLAAYAADAYRGAAYVFVRSGDSWIEEQKLVASDGAEGDNFGWSVSLGEDRALVGAFAHESSRGAAYVFVRSGSTWTEEQKLVASDGIGSDQFGYSVALAGDRALVGAPGNDGDRGAGYVFVRGGSAWVEEQKLATNDVAEADHLGVSVSLTEERALLGAYFQDYLRGAAYVFAKSGGVWSEEQKLVASDGSSGHRFGSATSLRGGRAVIGAFGNANGRGAAYVFARAGSTWTEEQRLVASDGVENDLFGWSVALDDNQALIGAQAVENLRGAVFAFSLGLENGEPCSTDADCASSHCFDARCCQTADCAPCTSDDDCPTGRHCATDHSCQPSRELGAACDDRAGEDCLLEECHVCQSGFCTDGVCCDRECTAAEACTAALKVSGSDGSCGIAQTAVNGSFCAGGESCTSGHCTDGVCCDAPCDGTCEACTAVLKGEGEDGSCGRVAADLNPSDECASEAGSGAADLGCACRAHSAPGRAPTAWLSVILCLLLLRKHQIRRVRRLLTTTPSARPCCGS